MQNAAAQGSRPPAGVASISDGPADLTPEKIAHARKAIDSGEQSVTGMAKLFNVHRVTLHKALKKDTAKRGTAA